MNTAQSMNTDQSVNTSQVMSDDQASQTTADPSDIISMMQQILSDNEVSKTQEAQALGDQQQVASVRPSNQKEGLSLPVQNTAVSSEIVAEAGASQGAIEQEISPEVELPPEVSGYIEELRTDLAAPSQIVVTDDDGQVFVQPPQLQDVVVLPATQEIVEKGLNSSPKLSIRWLAEWCVRMMKKYAGMVVYKE